MHGLLLVDENSSAMHGRGQLESYRKVRGYSLRHTHARPDTSERKRGILSFASHDRHMKEDLHIEVQKTFSPVLFACEKAVAI